MNIIEKIKNRKYKRLKLFFNNELTNIEREYLIKKYNINNIDEILYREFYNIIDIPKCKYCGNNALFINFHIGYRHYCSNSKCQYKNRKEKMLKKYGVENVFQLNSVKEKCKESYIKKYGVNNPSKSNIIKEKKEKTCLKNYGVTSPLKNKNIKEKVFNTNLIKYNNICSLNGKKQIQMKKQTWIDNYGVDNPSKSNIIKEKKEKTCLKNYGVTNWFKTNESIQKAHSATSINKCNETKRKNKTFNISKTEESSYKLLKEKYHDVKYQYISSKYPFMCDFYIPSLDLYIECNYHWTHGGKLYEGTKEDNIKLEKWKSKNTKYYNNAIKTWIDLDIRKYNIAKENKLNYKVFYTYEDFLDWIN